MLLLYILAHGKGQIYRVPVFVHTAKPWAHAILEVSGSEKDARDLDATTQRVIDKNNTFTCILCKDAIEHDADGARAI